MHSTQHFKTLCCLGLPPQAAMVSIAGALHEVVASEWNRVGLYDDAGRIGAGYAEHPGCVPLLMENLELFHGADRWWATEHPGWFNRNAVGDLLDDRFMESFRKSEIFDTVERPVGVHWMLDSIQPLARGKLGVQLLRSRRDKPFTAEDAARLRAIRPWMAHALRETSPAPRPADGSPGRELTSPRPLHQATLVLDRQGRTLFRTEGAEYLLSILGGMERELKSTPFSRIEDLPGPLREVLRRLMRASRGQDGVPPTITVPTSWGTVSVEAGWLVPAHAPPEETGGDTLINVSLALREHAAAFASRVLRASGATPAQVRVGVLLALGKGKPEIARELGVKSSSVEDAARKLYARLDVHSAAEFGALLWLTG